MIQSLISSAYLHPVLFSRDGQWLTQEPPRLSQLEIEMSILHGCRNLKFTSTIPSMFGVHTIWWRFWSRWTFRRTSIIRILLRLICFPSNLHVKGLSSWWISWISSKIQFCLVCTPTYRSTHWFWGSMNVLKGVVWTACRKVPSSRHHYKGCTLVEKCWKHHFPISEWYMD